MAKKRAKKADRERESEKLRGEGLKEGNALSFMQAMDEELEEDRLWADAVTEDEEDAYFEALAEGRFAEAERVSKDVLARARGAAQGQREAGAAGCARTS